MCADGSGCSERIRRRSVVVSDPPAACIHDQHATLSPLRSTQPSPQIDAIYFSEDAGRDVAAATCRRSRQWPRQKRRPQEVHRKGRNEPNSRSGRSQVRSRDRLSGRAPQAGQEMLQGSLRRSRRDISANVPRLRVQVQAQQASGSRQQISPSSSAECARTARAARLSRGFILIASLG